MKIVGRKDLIDIPKMGLYDVPAKIDTGAYNCALHCHQIELVEKDGNQVLRFKPLDSSHKNYKNEFIYIADFFVKTVKSSVGIAEKRFAVKTDLCIFGKNYKVTFTLTNRKKMRYPVLIGRKLLNTRFLVDVSLKDVSFKDKNSIK